MTNYLWMHYHIPKTGGTSFGTHLRALSNGDGRYLSVTVHEHPGNMTPAQVLAASPDTFESVEIVQGHGVGRFLKAVIPRPCVREIFVLRDPATRLVSHYNFTYRDVPEHQIPSLENHLMRVAPDYSLRFLARRLGYRIDKYTLDRVLADLAAGFTLTLDRLNEAVPAICRAMGYEGGPPPSMNVSGKAHPERVKMTDALYAKLIDLNPLDNALYQAAEYFENDTIAKLRSLQPGGSSC